ncbi:MAG TPA: DUF6600 domain-containing protein [Candidatus Angelobacter sp.]|jgi:hypothetical protein
MLRHSMRRWYLSGKSIRKSSIRRSSIHRSGLLLSMVFTLVFALAPFSQAQDTDDQDSHDSNARIVRISYVEGDVRLDNGHGYESATMNVPLSEHNWLQTGTDGWAEVQLEDGSMIRLAPDTVIAFTELGRLSSGGTVTTVDLDQGEAEFKIIKHDDSDFQVTVKKNTIAPINSGSFRVTSINSDPLELAVWKGQVSVRDGESGNEVAVKKGETFVIDPNDSARYALDNRADADQLDQWSKQRDDALSAYASAGQGDVQSPYQYGASDLDYYGQYYDVPGYGNLWQPNNVGLNWDPFSNGYWSYSPGFGYTWVSSYPWGWMPYRYGRWVFVNGRGWCWAPGGWNRWNSRPRLVNAPPGFHAPIPPVDRRIVNRTPGQVIRPGEPPLNRGVGGRTSGPGGRVADGDGNNRALDHPEGSRSSRRVLTNDDVQGRVPRTDVPAQVTTDIDRKPRTDEQPPAANTGARSANDSGRFSENRDNTSREPVRRSNSDASAPTTPRAERQYTPPPQRAYAPPERQERQYAPPPQAPVVHQAAPPPAMHQSAPPAAVQRQSGPPPESHARSDEGSRPKNR